MQGCLGLLLCSWQPHQPSSLTSHPTFGAELKILPPFREACVCNPWNHWDPFGFFRFAFLFCFTAGGSGPFSNHCLTKTLLIGCDIPEGRLGNVPATILKFAAVTHGTPSPCRFGFDLRVWPSFLLKTSRFQWFVLVLLGNGTLGRRVAPLSVQYTLS